MTTPHHRTSAPAVAPAPAPAPAAALASEGHELGPVVWWLEKLEAQQRGLDAARLTLIAAAVKQVVDASSASRSGAGRELAYRALRAELATAFNLSEHQTESQMDLAYRLTRDLPQTLVALERGEIACAHARVICDASAVIGSGDSPELAERRAGYEHQVLDVAVHETPNRLRPIAQRLAEQWAERPLEERHREARCERRVVVIDREDGMADLLAHLPAIEAHAIKDRLTSIARAAERGERTVHRVRPHHLSDSAPDSAPGSAPGAEASPGAGALMSMAAPAADDLAVGDLAAGDLAETHFTDGADQRTRDQLRADVFTDLLLAADEHSLFAGSTAEAIRARVQVIVPVDALGEERDSTVPCELIGSGCVGADTARVVASEATHWDQVDVQRESGEVLSVDRYRPSEQMRRQLGARDRHCRFPGCRVPVQRCDLDHTIDAALGGATSTSNLAHLCRGHHTLKHHTAWKVKQEPGGTLRWTSPTGRSYPDHPPGRVMQGRVAQGRGRPVRFTPATTEETEATATAKAEATAAPSF